MVAYRRVYDWGRPVNLLFIIEIRPGSTPQDYQLVIK